MPNLACVVRAHLDHGVTMLLAEIEQCQRNADVVIEIPLRDQTGPLADQYRPDYLFRRRFPVAPRHGHYRLSKPSAMRAGARGQGPQRVRDDDLGQGDRQRTLNQETASPAGGCGAGEFMAVKAFATERDDAAAVA